MRKLSLVAAGVSMAIAGSAHAALTVNANIFMSGASAPTNMLREHVVQNVCSQAAPINVYVDVVRTVPGAGNPALATPILEHTTHWVVECTAAAGTGTNLAGKTIAVYKSDVGGSGNGTTPIPNEVPMQFMNADSTSACTLTTANQAHGNGGTYNLYTCGTNDIVNQVADMGTSDIEPTKFTGTLAPASGDFVDLGNLTVKTGPGLVFGVAITKAFRNELQADQGLTVGAEDEANMPSLPQSYVSSITQGRVWRWSDEEVYGGTPNTPAAFAGTDGIVGTADDVASSSLTQYVNICRRTQGSGTHAQHMIEYHRTNCASGTIVMPPGRLNPTGNLPIVWEGSSSGNLGTCLDRLDKGIGYSSVTPAMPAGRTSFGLGYQATEKNMGLQENWRYVKIDGKAPTLQNAFKGDYDQVYYLSFQLRTADAPASTGQATAGNGITYETGAIRSAAADAGAIADFFNNNLNITGNIVSIVNEGFVHSWGQGGFLQPSTSAPAVFALNNPLTPWARETASAAPDSCQPLTRKR